MGKKRYVMVAIAAAVASLLLAAPASAATAIEYGLIAALITP